MNQFDSITSQSDGNNPWCSSIEKHLDEFSFLF